MQYPVVQIDMVSMGKQFALQFIYFHSTNVLLCFSSGAQFTEKSREDNLSRDQIIAREKKWLYMIANWKDYMSKNFKKVFCLI